VHTPSDSPFVAGLFLVPLVVAKGCQAALEIGGAGDLCFDRTNRRTATDGQRCGTGAEDMLHWVSSRRRLPLPMRSASSVGEARTGSTMIGPPTKA
jgi:hypothetical protein